MQTMLRLQCALSLGTARNMGIKIDGFRNVRKDEWTNMAKVGKKYAEAAKLADRSKAYTIEEAVALAKQTSTVKFDEVLSMGPKRLVLTLAIRN